MSGRISPNNAARENPSPRRETTVAPAFAVIVALSFIAVSGMNFDIRLRALFDQESDAPSLVAGEILIDDASARENQWKLFVRNFIRAD